MDGILNFPTYYSLRRVFSEGYPMDYLYKNLLEQRKYYKNLKLTGTFVDNHDQPRFLNLTNYDLGKLKNSIAFMLFGDGIPFIYAGTELEFSGGSDPYNRESMWPHFNERGEIFKFISKTLQFRKNVCATLAQIICIAFLIYQICRKNNNDIDEAMVIK